MAERIPVRALHDERDLLLLEIEEVVDRPEVWLDTPNSRFGGLRPRDLLQTEEGRHILHSLMIAVKHGLFT